MRRQARSREHRCRATHLSGAPPPPRSAAPRLVVPGIVVAALTLGGVSVAEPGRTSPAEQSLRTAGLMGNADVGAFVRQLLPATAEGDYVPDSSVLAAAGGTAPWLITNWPGRRDPNDPRGVSWARAWLQSGNVPGRDDAERAVARRALLDLALLTDPGGASIANPFGAWNYAWPRDAAWHAAAFAVTGHRAEALRILTFFARVQDPDGTWAARYHADGAPVRDGRARQLDAVGWLPWATWLWWKDAGDAAASATALGDGVRRGRCRGGLPARERVAPRVLGLHRTTRGPGHASARPPRCCWACAPRRISPAPSGTRRRTALGRCRAPPGRRHLRASSATGATAATPTPARARTARITFLTAPLAAPSSGAVYPTVTATAAELLMPSGGLRPGNMRGVRRHTFTPATALFALSAAGAGDADGFRRWFDWLVGHRTRFEAFPEKVTADGAPAAVAPLGWTCAIVLLALATRDGQVPTPPAL